MRTRPTLVANHSYKLNEAIDHGSDSCFEYFGLRTVYDRYLLRDPESRLVIETPQYFFMRVACGLSQSADEAIEFYRLISSLDYLPATPTLFNSGTTHPQMSACYLLDSPRGHARGDLRPLQGRRPAVEVRRRHRAGVPPGAQPRFADPGHERPVERHRAVAQDARLVGRPRSTRAASARARRASTSRRGTPTSRSSSSSRTTPATRPAARTTSTSPTGCPTCSWSGSRRTGRGRCSTPRRCRTSPTCYGEEFEQAYRRPRARSCTSARCRRASSTPG